ncbi:metallophosphoesterase [Sorangium sp. So ce854]|uniref:metallophosphoesterase n=1 Tax=Sorangium sp. So ce854 TaxID=3133322 RepID=UPI003F6377F8
MALAVVLATGAALAGHAFWVEPYRVEVSHHRVPMALARPLRVAHLSDLHTVGFGRRERRVAELLAREAPDVIVVTGDSIADDGSYAGVTETLRELHAPLGVWSVEGNWEHWRPSADARAAYAAAGVNDLTNASARLREDVWLVGLDDTLAGHPDAARAFDGVPRGAQVIVLLHSPVGVYQVRGRAGLVLAGHTHGGQIRWPWGTPLWLPPGSGTFVEGAYDVDGTTMYVSRGIGNSLVEARLFCRPEIAIFELGP